MSHFLFVSAPLAQWQHDGGEVRRRLSVSVPVLLCLRAVGCWFGSGWARSADGSAAALGRP